MAQTVNCSRVQKKTFFSDKEATRIKYTLIEDDKITDDDRNIFNF